MDFMLNLPVTAPGIPIKYSDKILVIGSCFTEHIGGRMQQLKFNVLQNPNGILFDPLSVCSSLSSYVHNRQYEPDDLFYLNELWLSWQHHSMFSGLSQQNVLQHINHAQQAAHDFLKGAGWLVITLGSSYSYQLTASGIPVANCHRAPAQWFHKHLLEIDDITAAMDNCIRQLRQFNAALQVVFTVSPVRHIRDGVVNNNRSKARLIESVHDMVNRFEGIHYFPAYELVIDVLRDYRFYDIDLVHPNYAATEYVFEKFAGHYIAEGARSLSAEIKNIITAYHHKPFQRQTAAHKNFLASYLKKVQQLQQNYPQIDFSREILYFSNDPDGITQDAF